MSAFWDVFWTDTKAAAVFVAPMLLLSLPTSIVGSLFGARNFSGGSWGRLLATVWRGVLFGTFAALVVSMILEFSLKVEGLPLSRRGIPQLVLVSPAAAFLAAYLAARRSMPAPLDQPSRRIYTLRQLLFAQFIAGLLLGWWVYTRREEIGQRRVDLDWQARDQAAKALFSPYGWDVATWREKTSLE